MEDKKIAVLIDAENVSGKYIKLILDEVSNYGTATYKRLYGDFQTASVKAWMKNLQDYAITPVFQYNYTQGKNASDSALIIDAMDILYSGNVDGFCIVTSDSDFTKLVLRLRESGMTVVGMGEQKTPNALVSACETFKFLDILFNEEDRHSGENPALGKKTLTEETEARKKETEPEKAVSNIPDIAEMEKEVISIINTHAGEDGWVDLSELGDNLPKRVPGFDPRNYNCSKLKQFIERFDSVEVRSARNPHNKILSVIYVRVKQEEEEPEKPSAGKRRRRRRKNRQAGTEE
ncbi:MAG: NYN domain-containing protein [Otoolea sp.]|nr:NYN domain-containing protein [Clostridiaceae bacterium]MDD6074517.1 NYN domain-containing protein [Clostridium sp.]MDY5483086.1 NYN domain-containing protein [Clostridium sp.]